MGLHATRDGDRDRRRERLTGILLGTAVGDALGLPLEGMSTVAMRRIRPRTDRFALLGRTGFVSDDTEQSALVAQCLARHPRDQAAFAKAFRRSLLGWFLRLPWGIGLGTLRACVRIAIGLRRTGVASAGNGAAMRAAIVGGFFADDRDLRREWSETLAEITHVDRRAVDGAVFVAELAAALVRSDGRLRPDMFAAALDVVSDAQLRTALETSAVLARDEVGVTEAATVLGTTGFVVSSVPFAAYCLLRWSAEPTRALETAIHGGGDTDTNAAILGAWLGALHGERGLPAALVESLCEGPFGRSHLRALANDLVSAGGGEGTRAAYSWLAALARNLALYPVVLAHGIFVLARR